MEIGMRRRSIGSLIAAIFGLGNFQFVAYGSPGEIRTPVDGSLPGFGVQSPSLARSFSTLASPLHHRATRDPGRRQRPNKPSAQLTREQALQLSAACVLCRRVEVCCKLNAGACGCIAGSRRSVETVRPRRECVGCCAFREARRNS
jgi:hypothetical protein